ncbi:prolipoprotein diacylglyceryl transferase [Maritimibacter dapengensis]|uniref:Phosphatidylglycerol--prolipoprotein diacylglyceryl transferase n=1 Tax=Maritimibacter dapengensis TaxID=2836868 RepID=A0ABS6T1L7_9RHOB|nr:prolipoprotein diacylglyceryl transferase [Maritimibacter dapengensis]MBV7378870.1 prolipoprotein diacylglyceryl transferase [Maritimibacter dapengensis]
MLAAIQFPDISPEVFAIDLFGLHLAVRWYALGYIVGIAIGWWIIRMAITRPRLWAGGEPAMTKAQLEELVTWMVAGIIIGGRLGFVLFYQPAYYLANPLDIVKLWQGGMSFHGGFLGVVVGVILFSRKFGLVTASVADLLAIATPPALGLVRSANFINGELWGRPTDAPWGVIFPGPAAQSCATAAGPCARHPSQLYEAGLEGLLLTIILLTLAFAAGWLKRPGMLAGLFFLGYGLARMFVEVFRQADPQFITPDNPLGHVIRLGELGLTMGQLLSLPMVLVGIATLIWAARRTT